jgi:hypothetical protein
VFTLVASKHNWLSKGVIGSGCAHRILKSRGRGRTWSEEQDDQGSMSLTVTKSEPVNRATAVTSRNQATVA